MTMTETVEILKCLGDPSRYQIVDLLCNLHGVMAYSRQIADYLNITEQLASHHLRTLHFYNIVKAVPWGNTVMYTINLSTLHGIVAELNQKLETFKTKKGDRQSPDDKNNAVQKR